MANASTDDRNGRSRLKERQKVRTATELKPYAERCEYGRVR